MNVRRKYSRKNEELEQHICIPIVVYNSKVEHLLLSKMSLCCRIPDSLPCFHDTVLAAAFDATVKSEVG